jgi:hypothetical protein
MLIPKMIFHCIRNEHGFVCFPAINHHAVKVRRTWRNKTPEERAAISATRSECRKRDYQRYPYLREARGKVCSKTIKKYWKNIDAETKRKHYERVSKSVKKAWDEGIVYIPTLNALQKINAERKVIIEKDLPRINDYCGVITSSELAQL